MSPRTVVEIEVRTDTSVAVHRRTGAEGPPTSDPADTPLSWTVVDWSRWLADDQAPSTMIIPSAFPGTDPRDAQQARVWADSVVACVRLLEAARHAEIGVSAPPVRANREWDDARRDTEGEITEYIQDRLLELFSDYGVAVRRA